MLSFYSSAILQDLYFLWFDCLSGKVHPCYLAPNIGKSMDDETRQPWSGKWPRRNRKMDNLPSCFCPRGFHLGEYLLGTTLH